MYRGKKVEELQKLSLKEFAQLLPARERRSLERAQTPAEQAFMKSVEEGLAKLKTHCRTIVITPQMIGKTIQIHRGNSFDRLLVTEEMIGHRLGEFALTRKRLQHSAPGVGATKSSGAISAK